MISKPGLMAVVLLLLCGCADSSPGPESASDETGSDAFDGEEVVVLGAPTCAECRIVRSGTLTAGDRDDPWSFAVPAHAASLPDRGVAVVSQGLGLAGVLAYDARGEFRGLWGGAGDGPGEFQGAIRIATSDQYVYAQDRSGRIEVFTPDGHFVRTVPGIPVPRGNPVLLSDSLLAMDMPRDEGDRRIQLYDPRSGERVGEAGPQRSAVPDAAAIHVAASTGPAFWLAIGPGVFERWGLDTDSPDHRIRLGPAWVETLQSDVRPSLPTEEAIQDNHLWEDPESGLIWITTVLVAPGEERGFPEVEPGAPLPEDFFSPRRIEGAMNTVVSVVDPVEQRLLARLPLPVVGWHFVEDGRLATVREAAEGFQWYEFLSFQLVR